MASDILLYNAKYVPVGDDQSQHLEFTRDIAERMNSKFGELFTVPEPVKKQHEFFGKDQGLRIKDLVDPAKKMSKSDDTGKGVIFLSDTPDVARKKIMSATTDDKASVAYDKATQPGISNLLEILTLARQANGKDATLQQVISEFEGQTRYGDFKKVVADEVATFLGHFQTAYNSVDMSAVEQKLQTSEAAMRDVANSTLLRVQKAVGLR
jgi:tryptophanyl-tRNA synthetase